MYSSHGLGRTRHWEGDMHFPGVGGQQRCTPSYWTTSPSMGEAGAWRRKGAGREPHVSEQWEAQGNTSEVKKKEDVRGERKKRNHLSHGEFHLLVACLGTKLYNVLGLPKIDVGGVADLMQSSDEFFFFWRTANQKTTGVCSLESAVEQRLWYWDHSRRGSFKAKIKIAHLFLAIWLQNPPRLLPWEALFFIWEMLCTIWIFFFFGLHSVFAKNVLWDTVPHFPWVSQEISGTFRALCICSGKCKHAE